MTPRPVAELDAAARLARALTGWAMAAVHVFDEQSQHRVGAHGIEHGPPVPRSEAMCTSVVEAGTALVLADASADDRFAENPFVARGLRAYAAVPLVMEGRVVGTLCSFDLSPQPIAPGLEEALHDLARLAVSTIAARRVVADLERRGDRYRRVLTESHDAFVSTDAAGAVTEWNDQAERLFGWSPEEAIGRNVADLIIPPELQARHHDGLTRFARTGESAMDRRVVVLEAVRRDGTRLDVEVMLWSTVDEEREFHAFARDIGDRLLAERDLRRQADRWLTLASLDSLTGLPNRSALLGELERRIDLDEPLGVVYVDVDDFKAVNDRYGHLVGDRALVATSEALRRAVRPDDYIARMGGDEFVVLCDSQDERDVRRVATRLASGVGVDLDEFESVVVNVSAGFVISQSGESAQDVLHRADLAMYERKRR